MLACTVIVLSLYSTTNSLSYPGKLISNKVLHIEALIPVSERETK